MSFFKSFVFITFNTGEHFFIILINSTGNYSLSIFQTMPASWRFSEDVSSLWRRPRGNWTCTSRWEQLYRSSSVTETRRYQKSKKWWESRMYLYILICQSLLEVFKNYDGFSILNSLDTFKKKNIIYYRQKGNFTDMRSKIIYTFWTVIITRRQL